MKNSEEHEFDAALTDLANRLPKAVAPKRDLWPGIEQAIESSLPAQRSSQPSMWVQAAAVLLLVGGSSALTYSVVTSGGISPTPNNVPVGQLVFEPVSGSFGSQYNLGPDYQDARRDLASRLNDELDQMDPDTRTNIESNLQTIQDAIADINRALADEPDNVLLQEMLLDTYRDELSLMRRIDGMSNATMRRDDI